MISANKSQLDKFKEAARELGADEDEQKFDKALRKMRQKNDDKAKGDDK